MQYFDMSHCLQDCSKNWQLIGVLLVIVDCRCMHDWIPLRHLDRLLFVAGIALRCSIKVGL
jgi:hypothetical protein